MPIVKATSRRRLAWDMLAPAMIMAWLGRPARADEAVPGGATTLRSKALETGADLLQRKAPLDAMNVYLDGFHFYADDMGRQVEAHHFCTHLTEEFHQCVIFDSDGADARLIGVEYIVSERLFSTLDEEERRLWHSHRYEVRSGQLIAPGLPEVAERAALADIVTTYGKTWHTWQIDRTRELPLGVPQLMMGFTRDGQIDPNLLAARDRRLGLSSHDRAAARADLPDPAVRPGADSWQDGKALQLALQERPVQGLR